MSRFRFRRGIKRYRPVTLLQQLEERIVLDAAVNPAPQDNPNDHPASQQDPSHAADAAAAGDHAPAAADSAGGHADGNAGLAASVPDSYNQVFHKDLNVVLVANNLADVQALSGAAAQDAKVIVYDAHQDNLASITAKLQDVVNTAGQKIDHVAILSHGEPGLLKLADGQVFDALTVQSGPAQWQAFGQLLSANARIDFYGCEIAGGSQGLTFVTSVADATGHTVWASNNVTGSISGADWQLEVKSGASALPDLIDGAKLVGTSIYLDSLPVAVSQVGASAVSVNEDGTLDITVRGYDADQPWVGSVSFDAIQPAHGTLVKVGGPSLDPSDPTHITYVQHFTYTPSLNANSDNIPGPDSFTFTFNSPAADAWQGFDSGHALPATPTTWANLAVADVNGDGWNDVISGYNSGSTGGFYVLTNNHNGTFTASSLYSSTSANTYGIAVGDVTGDGVLDVVVANNLYGTNIVFVGTWNGTTTTFAKNASLGFVNYNWALKLADIDHDGDLDAITGGSGTKVWTNNGTGTFALAATLDSTSYSSATQGLAVGDVNGDGWADIAAKSATGFNVYLNNGSGGFGAATAVTTGSSPNSIALGDLNGDGKLDVVVGSGLYSVPSKAYLHNATGDGFTYSGDIGTALVSGQNTYTLALGDVNGDGKLDAVQSGWGPHGVFLGDGAGHFSQDPAHPTYDSAPYLTTNSNMVLADMNNDGHLDVVQSLGKVYWNMGLGGGVIETSTAAQVDIAVNPVNDAPYAASFTGQIGANIDTPVAITGIQVNDVDVSEGAGSHQLTVELYVDHGSLSFVNTYGLTATGTGTLVDKLILTGTMVEINAALAANVTYNPSLSYNGLDAFHFTVRDNANYPAPEGSATSTAGIIVNNAPVLTPQTTPYPFTDITENDTSASVLVSAVVGGSIADDAGALQGIAVIGTSSTGTGVGHWEYYNGSAWVAFGTVDAQHALLLQSTDQVRFVGDTANGQTARFDYVAWDQVAGTAYTKVDASVTGGATPFSLASDYTGITVTGVNDAPVLTPQGTPYQFATMTENDISAGVTVSTIIGTSISDVDSPSLKGIAVTATSSTGTGAGHWEFLDTTTGLWTSFGTVAANNALLLGSTDQVRFVGDTFNGQTARFDYIAWDQTSGAAFTHVDASVTGGTTAFSTSTDHTGITLTDVSDAPVVLGQSVAVNPDGTLDITVKGFDADKPLVLPPLLSEVYFTATNPLHGTLTPVGSAALDPSDPGGMTYIQHFTYTPAPDYAGSDSYTFTFNTTSRSTWQGFDSGHALSATPTTWANIAVADVNGDGWNDVISGYNSGSTGGFYVLTNNHNGTFTASSLYSSTSANTYGIAVGDVTGDGVLDVVVANNLYGTNIVFVGTWNGTTTTFAKNASLGFVNYNWALKLADIDHDGDLDAITGGSGTKVWTNNGTGTFALAATLDSTSYSSATQGLAVGDVNGDGWADIAAKSATGFNVYLNNGSGGFGAATAVTTGSSPNSIALGDLNGDGKLDVVVGSGLYSVPSKAYLHNATGDGFTYSGDIGTALVSGQNTYTLALGDVNGDGKLDAVQSGWGPHGVFLGDGAGHFSQDPAHPTYDSAPYLTTNSNMVLADMNNDGHLDVVQSLGKVYFSVTPGGGTVEASIPVTMSPENQAPVINEPIVAQEVDPNGEVTFSTANGNLISISDVDAGTGLLKVTLTATHGTMTLNGAFLTGLSFDPALGGQGDGTADATMSFLGTQTDINNALNGMKFTHDAGFYGMADVTMNVNDQGNSGLGGAKNTSAVENISVEQYNLWFQGFGTETGWNVYNDAGTRISYYTHDYTVLWQHVTSTNTWNFFNGTDWVGTNDLGNAPYADGYGPFATWFPDNVTGGTYNGYEVYIHANGVTEFSLDHTAPGATYWQVTGAGAWTYFDGSAWYPTAGFNVGPDNVWYHGFGIGAGWNVYSDAGTNISYYSHDYTVLWQHVTSTNTWNFFNGTDWVGTNDLGNAPYADGYGPFGQWFPDNVTGGTYNGYEVYIHANGVTEFSLDHTAPGAQYWQVTGAGAWTYYDGSAWYSTAGFNVGPDNVWYHGFGTDAGWNVYNHSATSISYYTHDYVSLWQHVTSTNTWNFFDGSAWYATTGLNVGPVDVWYHGFGTYAGWEVYDDAATIISYYTHTYVTLWQHVTATDAWNYFDGTVWTPTTGLGVIV